MKDMSSQPIKIYVGNVPVAARTVELQELFEKFGKVVECDILKDFAFVHMDDTNDAKAAIAGLHDSLWKGARIRVELSTTRTNKGEPGERYSNSRDRDRDRDETSSRHHHTNGRSDRDRDRDRDVRDRPRRDLLPPLAYERRGTAPPYSNNNSRFNSTDTRRDPYPESRYYQDNGPASAPPPPLYRGSLRDSRYPLDSNRYPYPANDLAYANPRSSYGGGGSRNGRGDDMRLSSNDLGLELIRASNNGIYGGRERDPPYFDRRGGGGGPPPPLPSNGMRNPPGYDGFYRGGPPLPISSSYHQQAYNGYPPSSR